MREDPPTHTPFPFLTPAANPSIIMSPYAAPMPQAMHPPPGAYPQQPPPQYPPGAYAAPPPHAGMAYPPPQVRYGVDWVCSAYTIR